MYFSDVLTNGGGTAVAEGSHLVGANILMNSGLNGMTGSQLTDAVIQSGHNFNVVELTGSAGDVVLLHPLLLHARSTNLSPMVDEGVRFMAHPSVALREHLSFGPSVEQLSILEISYLLSYRYLSPDEDPEGWDATSTALLHMVTTSKQRKSPLIKDDMTASIEKLPKNSDDEALLREKPKKPNCGDVAAQRAVMIGNDIFSPIVKTVEESTAMRSHVRPITTVAPACVEVKELSLSECDEITEVATSQCNEVTVTKGKEVTELLTTHCNEDTVTEGDEVTEIAAANSLPLLAEWCYDALSWLQRLSPSACAEHAARKRKRGSESPDSRDSSTDRLEQEVNEAEQQEMREDGNRESSVDHKSVQSEGGRHSQWNVLQQLDEDSRIYESMGFVTFKKSQRF